MAAGALLTASVALCAQAPGYWHTSGNQILDGAGKPVKIQGINWAGFESKDQIVGGLADQDYRQILHTIHAAGFNTVRLPFSNEMVESPITHPFDHAPAGLNIELADLNSLQIMDRIISAAGTEGLKVILDDHRSDAGNSNQLNGLWYTSAYPESAWIADWETLTRRYKDFTDAAGNPIVIAMDLRNEPYSMVNGQPIGACWTGDTTTQGCPVTDIQRNWPQAAGRAAAAILNINPNLLIVVEGVDCYSGSCNWQGGNLEGAGPYPVQLPFSGHLVYSAHDYGPIVSPQPWFRNDTTQGVLEDQWTKQWAYLSDGNVAPVWVGEFGTTNNPQDIENAQPGSQGQWFSALIQFLGSHPRIGWAYWSVNPEDVSGLLSAKYGPPAPNSPKMAKLKSIETVPERPAGSAMKDVAAKAGAFFNADEHPLRVKMIVGIVLAGVCVWLIVLLRRRKPPAPRRTGGNTYEETIGVPPAEPDDEDSEDE